MLKRQESSLSSSRRQSAAATPPPPATSHAKSIGCMSGIIHLFSKYQTPNKRLTFGKKQAKRKPPPSPETTRPVKEDKPEKQYFDDEASKLKCEIKFPRSPTIPAEIRRSDAPGNRRTPSSLVARLMGLEDMGSAAAVGTAALDNRENENPITEKRQRLLQALEKCNEDLEALKKIIKAVQTTSDVRLQPPPHMEAKRMVHVHPGGGNAGLLAAKPCMRKCTVVEANIPAATVDELTRSPPLNIVQSTTTGAARVPPQRKPTALTPPAKKPGEDHDQSTAKILINNKCSATINDSFSSLLLMRRRAAASPPWSSRAMVQSVEEVCGDIAWGEKRESGRIGVVLQDHLCRELIDELVKDLLQLPKWSELNNLALPLEACKKRLCF